MIAKVLPILLAIFRCDIEMIHDRISQMNHRFDRLWQTGSVVCDRNIDTGELLVRWIHTWFGIQCNVMLYDTVVALWSGWEDAKGGERTLLVLQGGRWTKTLTGGWKQQRCESREMRCRWNQKRKTRNSNDRRSYQKNLNRIRDTGYGHTVSYNMLGCTCFMLHT